jgi:hypothetical protein
MKKSSVHSTEFVHSLYNHSLAYSSAPCSSLEGWISLLTISGTVMTMGSHPEGWNLLLTMFQTIVTLGCDLNDTMYTKLFLICSVVYINMFIGLYANLLQIY